MTAAELEAEVNFVDAQTVANAMGECHSLCNLDGMQRLAFAASVLVDHLAWLDEAAASRYPHARGDLDDCAARIRAALAAIPDDAT